MGVTKIEWADAVWNPVTGKEVLEAVAFQETSRDIVHMGPGIPPGEAEEQEAKPEPVTTKLDLSLFQEFVPDGRGYSPRAITVQKSGKLIVYAKAVKLAPEYWHKRPFRVRVFLNRKGTIIVVMPVEGISGFWTAKDAKSLLRWSRIPALKEAVAAAGIELQARYAAEWDVDLGAWVGRLTAT